MFLYERNDTSLIRSAEEFVKLRTSDNPDEYLRVAWEEAPLEVWLEVIDYYPDMAFWVAQNKTVPIEVLELLVNHPEWRVRSMVACKNKLPEELQVILAKDHDVLVRKSIAYNKKATRKALMLLIAEEDDELRNHVLARIAEGRHK